MRIKRTLIERIRITAKYSESEKAINYCRDGEYHIVRSGPLPIGIGKVDPDRFLIIAEREAPKVQP